MEISKETQDLIQRIEEFLSEHATSNPNWEDEDDNKYTSPDAEEFAVIAGLLRKGIAPYCKCSSSFLHGDYRPYTDSVRGIHDELKREVNELITKLNISKEK